MGNLDPRLTRRYEAVKENIPLPLIITTRTPITQATLQAAATTGAGPITFTSPHTNSYGTSGTRTVAERLANLDETRTVYYDEPITTA